MVSRVALVLWLTGMAAQAGIDFTPTPVFVQFEGTRVEQPGFHNGADSIVTFEPPAGWSFEGAGPVLKLLPKEATLALARVETRPLPTTAVDSEEGLKFAREYLAGLLPREASGLRWEAEVEKNPILLNRHESVRLEATYSAFNQELRAAVIVCNLADQQLLFVVSGREREFAKLYADWKRSLFTWQGLK